MIPGFEGLFTAPVNVPQVITSSAGVHVAVVSRRTAPVVKKQVAIYEMAAVASSKTYNKVFAEANAFAAAAGHSREGYLKAVEETGQASHKLNVTEATSNYGAISQAKEVTRWVFDAKRHPEGFRPHHRQRQLFLHRHGRQGPQGGLRRG